MFWSSSLSSSHSPKIDTESLRRHRISSSKIHNPDVLPRSVTVLTTISASSDLRNCILSILQNGVGVNVAKITEVPPVAMLPNWLVQMKVLYPFRKQVGGTVLAAKFAKERGWAINVGGGFHHCSGGRGDAHQGNGHEMDFGNDEHVYILDMYNPQIYPFDMTARNYIDLKVEVVTGTTTDEYLKQLDKALAVAWSNFAPELIIYNAGTDILDGDPLGGLKVSPDGVVQRDEKVFRFARERNIPIVMVTSGGYMKTSARVIANSIINLSKKGLIDTSVRNGRK
ncbi:Histone deacetylase 11 [Hibiscus syriacus]|uniref:Histone deacetylase 11 n=1 Tax=Hibiscus syriacus TaxID=106335 RepID=A0A6A2YL30_HIBSY|nr:Histone deacetylase 11 [Hibiscus syriacus]